MVGEPADQTVQQRRMQDGFRLFDADSFYLYYRLTSSSHLYSGKPHFVKGKKSVVFRVINYFIII